MRQISRTQRRLAAGAFLIVAAPVALGSVAYACQSLATLHANPSSVAPGGTVTLTGKNYSSSAESTPVQIRLDDRDGAIIATFPAGVREINGSVTIPASTSVGVHTIIATQYTNTGNPVSGTPGRATVSVTVAPRSAGEGAAAPAATTAESAAAPVAAAPAAPAAQAAAPAAMAAPVASVSQATAAAPAAAAVAPAAADVSAPAGPAVAGAAGAAAAGAPVTAAAADQPAPASAEAAQVGAGLLTAASTESSSVLPGITLAAALALVVLGLGAFVKSGRNISRNFAG